MEFFSSFCKKNLNKIKWIFSLVPVIRKKYWTTQTKQKTPKIPSLNFLKHGRLWSTMVPVNQGPQTCDSPTWSVQPAMTFKLIKYPKTTSFFHVFLLRNSWFYAVSDASRFLWCSKFRWNGLQVTVPGSVPAVEKHWTRLHYLV